MYSEMESFEAPYRDYLQSPLQPLMDNLESQTYETFERDPVKYERYEKAVEAALADTPENKVSVIMVVGAGRGPLVRAALRAADTVGRDVRMYAVEKNPNAVVTLLDLHRQQGWGERVTIGKLKALVVIFIPPEVKDLKLELLHNVSGSI